MSRLQSLVANLPRAFSKDPQPVSALLVSFVFGANFVVRNGYLTSVAMTGSTALNISLRGKTMLQVATAINAVPNYTASVFSGLNAINAATLLEGQYNCIGGVAVSIPYYTSGTWRILGPIGATLDDIDSAWNSAVQQVNVTTASSVWLDRIGVVYGIPRAANEADFAYARRINQSAVAVKENGYAILSILAACAGVSTGTLTEPGNAAFTVTITINDVTGITYDPETINSFIKDYKALGTIGTLVFLVQAAENYTTTAITDSFSDSGANVDGQWGMQPFGKRVWN